MGAAFLPRPFCCPKTKDYGFFGATFEVESTLVVVVVVVVFFVVESVCFAVVSAAGVAAAAAGAAAAGASAFFSSPEQAASTSAAATNAIFFMVKSPYENWIGPIETAPNTQSSDSDQRYRFQRGISRRGTISVGTCEIG
jgi:hypothetical protein